MDVGELRGQLDEYLDGVNVDRVAEVMAKAQGSNVAAARTHLTTHIGEARVALRLVIPSIKRGARVLEVGSGIGLFAGFLRSIKIDVTELEPVGMGFQFIGDARSALAEYTTPSAHLNIGVEQLHPAVHGHFDLIFSLNVLEHVSDWRLALNSCSSVLADGGHMVHAHPNYTVPYEPHFGIPLVPLRPALTSVVLPRRISESDVWESLNWITARQVRHWCRVNAFEVEFRAGVLAETLDRLVTDPVFMHRHGAVIRRFASMARRVGLFGPLSRVPASLATPMEYCLRRTS